MKLKLLIVSLIAAWAGAASASGEHVVAQKNKSFTLSTLNVEVGDKVVFRNDDPFVHNVFSLTDAAPFDLGTYPQGQGRHVVFSKPGKFEIECAIHPEMRMVVTVAN